MIASKPIAHRAMLVVLAAASILAGIATVRTGAATEKSPVTDARAAIARGSAYLMAQQQGDGSWEDHVGFTAIAILALLPTSVTDQPSGADATVRGLAYLDRWARPDGGIYQEEVPYYTTAVSLLAFAATGDPKFKARIAGARDFLVQLQAREENGFSPTHASFGGTLTAGGRANLDATVFAMRALAEARLPRDHPYWSRALRFVTRCQNWKATNDQPWAGTDGGFVFSPGFSFAGGTTSYGTMTYAGLSAYLDAGLPAGDERVIAALRWLGANFTARENPGLQKQTLYHSYLYMTQTLGRWGVDTLVDGRGQTRWWRRELVEAVLASQRADGSWSNTDDPRWYESKPVVATSFAVWALKRATATAQQ